MLSIKLAVPAAPTFPISSCAFKSLVEAIPFLTRTFPVILEMLVVPDPDCATLDPRNPAMDASSWLTFAPEYFTLLKSRLAVPFSARMISGVEIDLIGPDACRSRFMVPAPLTFSRAVTP